MKKSIVFFLSALLALSLAACGGKEDEKKSDSTAPAVSVVETAEAAGSTDGSVGDGQVLPDMPID